ncbi:MAG: membrane protein insertase YidC [Alphaproteobacteria bacterium]|jgi:YidC/Oxa1 family membrane protein insertase|nr:membrane protein insertase YidC [Alphaproteobacteria bacterium]
MSETKNLIIAVILSVLVIILWESFKPKRAITERSQTENIKSNLDEKIIKSDIPIKLDKPEKIIAQNIFFENEKIEGNINLKSLRFNELYLKKYDLSKDSVEKVDLLQSKDPENTYFTEFSWKISNMGSASNDLVWKLISGDKLTPNSPIKLLWRSNNNLIEIVRTLSVDNNYMFKINDTVKNNANYDIKLNQYGLINKTMAEVEKQFFILHEGPIGVFNNALHETKFNKLIKKGKESFSSTKGWAGISDKYWLTAIIPDKKQNFNYRFTSYLKNNTHKFQVDMQGDDVVVAAGETYNSSSLLFSGAKEISLIDKYETQHEIILFDRAIDFGILYFLTKPIYLMLKAFYTIFSNFGVAIIALTISIRILMYPLASKSFREISKIKNIQPELLKLREKYGADKMRMQREVMSLYKAHKIKPMMGCLPVLVQVFVFFALYKVLFVTIDMRHAEFFGWITDLTEPDPTCLFNLFGLLPLNIDAPFGIWPCLLCITMILQQKLNPSPADPMQAKMMKFLPYIFLILFASFPAGLVIYWTFNNGFSIIQQYIISKQTQKTLNKV